MMNTELTHHTSPTKINLEIAEVTITNSDRLQRRDKIRPLRIYADNPNRIRLILQYSTGSGIESRVTIYRTTRNSQLPTTVTNQT